MILRDTISGERLPLPNTAADVVKADLAYGREKFGARLRYRWRGKSLKSSFSDSGLSVWNRPVGSLDLNMGWQLNGNVQVGLSARNLLNEEQVQTTDYSGQIRKLAPQTSTNSRRTSANWSCSAKISGSYPIL